MPLSPDRLVALAAIIGAHGVTGEVRLKLLGEGLDSLKPHRSFNGGALTLTSLRAHKAGAIARFAEIADRNAAEAARGTELTVPRSALPPLKEGEYYHVDLVGLPCATVSGDAVGSSCAVYNYGAGDILEIERENGNKVMVPMSAVELRDGRLEIDADFLDQ